MGAPIAVTGATGFVGSHLIRQLLRDGLPVRAVVRSTASASALREAGCEVALADVRHQGSLVAAFGGCRAVVHLVAIIRETRDATFDRVNVEGTAHAMAAAREAGVSRFVHQSALGAGPHASRYLRSKWAGEEMVRRGDVRYVIFKPSIVIGPGGAATQLADVVRFGLWYPFVLLAGGRRVFARLAEVLPVIPVLGTGRYRAMPVSLDDLLVAVRQAVDRDDVLNETYELGGPDVLTYDEILDHVAGVLGVRRWKFHLPWAAARAVVRGFARLPHPPITDDEFDSLVIDNICDNTKTVRTFGLRLRPLDQALREALVAGEANC